MGWSVLADFPPITFEIAEYRKENKRLATYVHIEENIHIELKKIQKMLTMRTDG
jgi:hypothetical protein